MARRLVIVSRQHPDLHAYLHARFQGVSDVEIVLDRRRGKMVEKRRRGERRSRPAIDLVLQTRSHVIVTIP